MFLEKIIQAGTRIFTHVCTMTLANGKFKAMTVLDHTQ